MAAWPYESGDMARRIREYDWTTTPLGAIEQWPQSRRTTVELMLASGHAMQLALGPDRTLLYNDAYAPMLGDHHPRALGMPFRDAWPDIWSSIEPMVDRVFAGETVRFEDMPLIMHRHGYDEETWWSFSYSPVRDETGAVAGLLNVTVDVSAKHRAARAEERYRTLFANMDQGYALADVIFDDSGHAIDLVYVESNPAGDQIAGTAMTGRRLSEMNVRDQDYWLALWERVALTGQEERFERYASPNQRWYSFSLFKPEPEHPESRRVAVLFHDVTERKYEEARQAFLLKLSDAMRPMTDPSQIETVATHLLGEHLAVNRAFYADAENGWWVVTRGFERDIASLPTSRFEMAEYGDWIIDGFRLGKRLVVDDMAKDPRFDVAQREAHLALQIGAEMAVPLVKNDRLVAMFVVHCAAPRAWSAWDIALLEETAERTWAAGERARAEGGMRESQERLRLALGAGRMGTWQWEVSSDRFRRGPNLNRLLGLAAAETASSIDDFLEHVHAEDRVPVRDVFESSARNGHDMQVDFRVVHADNSVVWLTLKGDVFAGEGRYLAGACVDITERKRLEDELREADQRKDEFLAMLGHELRNPLAPLSNVVSLLQRPNVDPVTQQHAHAVMQRQVDHLTRLVNDLLDVSRITLRRIELHLATVNMTAVAEQAIEMAMPAIDGHGQTLTLALSRDPLLVRGDAARLTQVIFNLLNNASKYTPDRGQIWLSVESDGGRVVVRVRDNGSGMPSELVPQVFDLFTQGDHTLDRSKGGLGLGLTLVKRLVEMHGGAVEASSAGLGHGSEFVVRLPELPAAAHLSVDFRSFGRAAPPVPKTALVVDDVVDIADSYVWLFEGLMGDVQVAYSGANALELAQRRPPHLVICDIGMPDMDGYETCRRLRQVPGLRTATIAAVSGYGGDEYVQASKAAGFDHHLVKPISRATLEELVKAVSER